MKQLRQRLQRFMYGRYGADRLSQVLSIAAVLVSWVGVFLNDNGILMACSVVLFAWAIFRIFSKNIARRAKENRDFLNAFASVKQFFLRTTRRMRDSKTYRYVSCPACKSEMRVPRGKGKIRITCPKCSAKFESRS